MFYFNARLVSAADDYEYSLAERIYEWEREAGEPCEYDGPTNAIYFGCNRLFHTRNEFQCKDWNSPEEVEEPWGGDDW